MLKENIKKARLKAGLTQKEVAEKMGIKQPNYGQWERGIRKPKQETLEKLAEIFSTTTDELTGRQDGLEKLVGAFKPYTPYLVSEEDKKRLTGELEAFLADYFKDKLK